MSLFKSFFRHYLELPEKKRNIVCLGGGMGTAQVLRGLKNYDVGLTAVVSLADNGGSSGRLRRSYAVPPPGDVINCLAALSDDESVLREMLLYRFDGDRYGKDNELGGQKLGNLMMVSLAKISGGFNEGIVELSKLVNPHGIILPATRDIVDIWAETEEGNKVFGEENVDLGRYNGSRSLRMVHLNPPAASAYAASIKAIEAADLIVIGPGDLYSTVLPVLIVRGILAAVKKSRAPKVYIVNVTNKPFETPNYKVSDYVSAFERHFDDKIFDIVLQNTNHRPEIPAKYKSHYVEDDSDKVNGCKILKLDLIDYKMPIHHNSHKVAQAILGVLES